MKNQMTFPENLKEVRTAINLLFYALSSTQKNRLYEGTVDMLHKYGNRIQIWFNFISNIK